MTSSTPRRGRGAAINPPNRFERIHLEPDADWDPAQDPAPATVFLKDTSETIINFNDSPDIGFNASINPYRGCEHGCAYCYARPTHEYLGFSSGLDFESRIMVKLDAAQLLEEQLASPKWKCQVIAMSGVTDCYQPVERKLALTRSCLQVLARCRNPVALITKNHLVTRDLDLLSELAKDRAAVAYVSVTSLDPKLAAALEPRASLPSMRLAAVEQLAKAGIPVGVMVAPVIPALTDHEIPSILKAAADHGAFFAGYVPLRLPWGLSSIFGNWLDRHYPLRKEKILGQIRSMRDGKMNDSQFGSRMRGSGPVAERIRSLFEVGCRRVGLNERRVELNCEGFQRPEGGQLTLL